MAKKKVEDRKLITIQQKNTTETIRAVLNWINYNCAGSGGEIYIRDYCETKEIVITFLYTFDARV